MEKVVSQKSRVKYMHRSRNNKYIPRDSYKVTQVFPSLQRGTV